MIVDPVIARRAAGAAVRKLDPRNMVRTPIMFVVEIGSVITTIEFSGNPDLFVGLVAAPRARR
jgi:potassium-transporting ATPase ATP-binding subunit